MQQVWTLEAKMLWRSAQGTTTTLQRSKERESREPKKIDDVGTNQDYHLNEVDIVSVSQYQPQEQE